MFDDMGELEILIRMERYYGPLSKKLPAVYTTDLIDKMQAELTTLIQRYKNMFKIQDNMPRIRIWIEQNSAKFLFFDKHTGKRIILGEWLSKKPDIKEVRHDH
jgi:hypothetical protein